VEEMKATDYTGQLSSLIFSKQKKELEKLQEELKEQRSKIHKKLTKDGEEWNEHSKNLIRFGEMEALIEVIHEVNKNIFPEEAFELVKNKKLYNILNAILNEPGQDITKIAEKIKMNIDELSGHIETLIKAEFVMQLHEGKITRHYLTPYAEGVMEEYKINK